MGMNIISFKKILLLFFVLLLTIGSSNAQILKKNASKNIEKGLFNKSHRNAKEPKVKEPGKVLKAKKKQEANEKKIKSDYAKSVKKSQKRTYDIQTPEVQARMKQNQKDSALRDKEKKKNVKNGTKKAGKKYK
jgi:hypothetical protein